jgi:hypothetical protein
MLAQFACHFHFLLDSQQVETFIQRNFLLLELFFSGFACPVDCHSRTEVAIVVIDIFPVKKNGKRLTTGQKQYRCVGLKHFAAFFEQVLIVSEDS